MGDVLDERLYDGHSEDYLAGRGPCEWRLVVHIKDLKAEVRRLRALPGPELTADEERARRDFREWCTTVGPEYKVNAAALAIIDRICPPKTSPSDEELARKIEELAVCQTSLGNAEELRKVASALRARKEQK